jgi:hypothetical protein
MQNACDAAPPLPRLRGRDRLLTNHSDGSSTRTPFLYRSGLGSDCQRIRSQGGDVQSSQKSGYDIAQRAAQMLRGEVIDLFAQIERAVSTVLVHAAALPEYKGLRPALPHLMGQKLERLRKLMSEAGPLKSRISGVAPLVEKLASFEDLRHFMAHGTVEVALKQDGEPIYIFRMISDPDGKTDHSTLTLTRPEAQSRRARLADITRALASKLEATTDGKGKQPR